MKSFFFACLLLFSLLAYSQQTVVDVDKSNGLPQNAFYTVSGSPVVGYRFVRLVQGTPFFKESWMKCIAVSDEGKYFKCNQV
ncbi:hypothetical protein V2W55_20155, partial [Acinetobacter baumannii]|uniref:hypothetical protein n=1 Tax=Acinetobacter baumannii TaxID=470 RepID=UPI00312C9D98